VCVIAFFFAGVCHPHTPCTLRPNFRRCSAFGQLVELWSLVQLLAQSGVLQFCSVAGLAVSLCYERSAHPVRRLATNPSPKLCPIHCCFSVQVETEKKTCGNRKFRNSLPRAARARNCRVEGQAAASPKQASSSHQVLNSEFSSIHPDTRSVWCARHKQLNVQRRLAGPR
jgi:hypothetical protein